MVAPGDILGSKYRLVRLIGDGGMGSVWEARHEALGTRIAIKTLHTDLASKPGMRERFLQEARVAAQIRSPHVVQVTDVDVAADGTAYLVMELLEGEPLSRVLERDRKIPIPTACDYTSQILEALEAAHAMNVTHRDLKPENVFVTRVSGAPWLKLIDFGIAKLRSDQGANLTVAGVIMGTAEYMAPEQARSADQADARSDIYAVGVMLYEMIAGVRPVTGDDARFVAVRVEMGEQVPLRHVAPEVLPPLADLIHRAIAPKAAMRFSSAEEMRHALIPYARMQPSASREPYGSNPSYPNTPAPVYPHPTPPARRGTEVPDAPRYQAAAASARISETVPGAFVPSPQAARTATPPRGSRARKRKSSLVWVLVLIPLLLGAGVVLAIVYRPDATDPVAGGGGGPTSTATTTATGSAATATPIPLATLKPATTQGGQVPAHPGTSRPRVDGGPAGSSSSNPPDFSFPGIPTQIPTFPMPPGLPTAFPFPIPTHSAVQVPTIPVPTSGPGF